MYNPPRYNFYHGKWWSCKEGLCLVLDSIRIVTLLISHTYKMRTLELFFFFFFNVSQIFWNFTFIHTQMVALFLRIQTSRDMEGLFSGRKQTQPQTHPCQPPARPQDIILLEFSLLLGSAVPLYFWKALLLSFESAAAVKTPTTAFCYIIHRYPQFRVIDPPISTLALGSQACHAQLRQQHP